MATKYPMCDKGFNNNIHAVIKYDLFMMTLKVTAVTLESSLLLCAEFIKLI